MRQSSRSRQHQPCSSGGAPDDSASISAGDSATPDAIQSSSTVACTPCSGKPGKGNPPPQPADLSRSRWCTPKDPKSARTVPQTRRTHLVISVGNHVRTHPPCKHATPRLCVQSYYPHLQICARARNGDQCRICDTSASNIQMLQ